MLYVVATQILFVAEFPPFLWCPFRYWLANKCLIFAIFLLFYIKVLRRKFFFGLILRALQYCWTTTFPKKRLFLQRRFARPSTTFILQCQALFKNEEPGLEVPNYPIVFLISLAKDCKKKFTVLICYSNDRFPFWIYFKQTRVKPGAAL